jgi:general secretion pathway protein B
MSFILDALKKSEIERQRQTVPGLMDSRIAKRRGRLPVWAIAIGVLLGINLFVLGFLLLRKAPPATHAPAPAPAPAAVAVAVAEASRAAVADAPRPAPEHFSPLDSAPVYAPEIPVAATGSAAPSQSPPARLAPPPDGAAKTGLRSARRPDPLLVDQDAQSDNQEVLPSISEISLTGAQTLPELHLDVHVYATKPADRFVYINMRKYHEGAPLQEGPILERIRRDGVILNYQGLRFLLPRQP